MLEVQVHPEDISQPVRYYFLPARTVAWLAAGAVAAVGLLACGVLLAPRGVEALLLRARTDQALRENRDQTEAIRRQAEQLRQLEQRVEAAAMLQSRLALVFGAAETESFAGGRSGPPPGDAASPVAALELAGELHLATDRLLRSAASLGALIQQSQPRAWKEMEVSLVEEAGERMQTAIERAQAENRLHDSERRFRILASAVPSIVWTSTPDGQLRYVNDRWYDFTGLHRQEGTPLWTDLKLHPEDAPGLFQVINTIKRSQEEVVVEVRLERQDGVYRWFQTRSVPTVDEHGMITAWRAS